VFLGAGERATDLPLVAHEVAHVVQQRGATAVQPFTRDGGDPHEREARHAAAAVVARRPFTVTGWTAPRVQRLGIGDALKHFADEANLIPGFRMFTIILGVNPINMTRVESSAANILRAVVEFIPGGGLITQALDNYGVFDRVGGWVEEQIRTLGMTGSAIRQALDEFLHSLSWSDILDLGGVWDRAKEIFSRPIRRIMDFAAGLVTGILRFIREAILLPLARLAQETRGYDLLKAVLGQDPITGEAVPRTAEALIGGFMRLIGQEEVWNNLKQARAVERAWAWFQGTLAGLLAFVRQIPALFLSALQQLELADIVLLPRAFIKVARVFGGFAIQFGTWATQQVLSLLQIIFEVVAPGAMPYIRKAAGAFRTIIADPIRFIGHLVAAAKLGFQNFASNFLEHLKAGLLDWLTGSLPGVYIPKSFALSEIVKFVFSVLGISWQNIRQKIVNVIGEPAMAVLEKGFDIVVTLVKEGPAAAWEKIKESLTNLKDMVIGGITDFVVDTVVKKAIPQLVSLFIPGAGFITAIIKIYDTIMVFVQKISKIIQVVTAFIDSIARIAAGDIASAAKRVESILANLLSLAINFLAGFVGLGKVADKIMGVIKKIQATIDKALDKLVAWIVATARRLGRLVAQGGLPADPAERLRLGMRAAVNAVNRFAGRRIGAVTLTPLLAAIRTRYGFSTLEVVQRNERWWLRGQLNPTDEVQTDAQAGEGDAQAAVRKTATPQYTSNKGRPASVSVDPLTSERAAGQEAAGLIQREFFFAFVRAEQQRRKIKDRLVTVESLSMIHGTHLLSAVLGGGSGAENIANAARSINMSMKGPEHQARDLTKDGWELRYVVEVAYHSDDAPPSLEIARTTEADEAQIRRWLGFWYARSFAARTQIVGGGTPLATRPSVRAYGPFTAPNDASTLPLRTGPPPPPLTDVVLQAASASAVGGRVRPYKELAASPGVQRDNAAVLQALQQLVTEGRLRKQGRFYYLQQQPVVEEQ
jgi:hypothetical protein